MCCDSCDFSSSWIFSFSPVVNTCCAWCFSLAKSRACSAELPLGPAHPPLSYCSAVTPQDSSPSCSVPGSSSSPTASAHPRGGCPSPCLCGPWTNPAEFIPYHYLMLLTTNACFDSKSCESARFAKSYWGCEYPQWFFLSWNP